jgi:hypothetical protein
MRRRCASTFGPRAHLVVQSKCQRDALARHVNLKELDARTTAPGFITSRGSFTKVFEHLRVALRSSRSNSEKTPPNFAASGNAHLPAQLLREAA